MIDWGRVLCVLDVWSLDPGKCLRCVRLQVNAVSGLISMSLKKHKSANQSKSILQ